jgi:hypothetical protein
MKAVTKIGIGVLCMLLCVVAILVLGSGGLDEKRKNEILADLFLDKNAVSIVAMDTVKRPGSINTIVVGTIPSKDVTVVRSAVRELGLYGQIAEFNLINTLSNRQIPSGIASGYGEFPFPSEYRGWRQKIAGFDAKVELYFEPRSGRFVAMIWGGR